MLGVDMFSEILFHIREVSALRALVAAGPKCLHHTVNILRVQGQAWK